MSEVSRGVSNMDKKRLPLRGFSRLGGVCGSFHTALFAALMSGSLSGCHITHNYFCDTATTSPATGTNTWDTGYTGDTADTEDTEDTGGTEDTGDTGGTEDTGDTGGTVESEESLEEFQARASEWNFDSPSANLLSEVAKTVSSFEASGVVYLSSRDSFLVVSDNGVLAEIKTNGAYVNHWDIGGDLEGITLVGDRVFLLVEPSAMIEFDIENGIKIVPEFTFTDLIVDETNYGAEGLTYIPDLDGYSEGAFAVATQSDKNIALYDAEPILNGDGEDGETHLTSYDSIPGSMYDNAGLYHGAELPDYIYVLSDSAASLNMIDLQDGSIVVSFTGPYAEDEGVAMFDFDCNGEEDTATLVIAVDSGALRTYTDFPVYNCAGGSADD